MHACRSTLEDPTLSAATGVAGSYVLTLGAAGVADVAGNAPVADASEMWTTDLAGPTVASASATDVKDAAATGHVITVTYADGLAVNAATIDGADLLITGPGGYSASPRLVSVSGTGASRTATYAAAAPAGGWTGAHAGTYVVALRANQVGDTAGNFAAATTQIASFRVTIDDTPPTVSIAPITPNPRGTPVDAVTVTFSEPVSGFDLADLSLTRDGVGVGLAGATLTTSDNVTFNLAGLGAATAASGAYALKLNAAGSGIVDRGGGNPLAAGATVSWTTDATAPTVPLVSATGITDPSAAGHAITVTYADNLAIDPATIDGADLLVTGANGYTAAATLVSVAGTGVTSRTATYAADAPLGGWDAAYNGSFVVSLLSGQVADIVGNFVAAKTLASFDVAIPDGAPTAVIAPVTPDPRNTSVAAVTIAFDEPVTGFDPADLTLTRGGAAVSLGGATLSTADGGNTFILGDLSAPTGAAGAYVLTLAATGSGIADLAGNAMADGASVSWHTDLAAPVAAIAPVSPDPRDTPVGSVTVTFSEPITGFDPADLTLTRDGAAVSLAGVTVTPLAGTSGYAVGNLTAATTAAGAYTLSVAAAGSGITDAAGNAMTAAASTSFTVRPVTTTPEPQAAAVTLRPAADAFVRGGPAYANTNYGTTASLHVKRGTKADVTREAYLRFDLSTVAGVGSAKLRLFGKLDSTTDARVPFAVYEATNTTWGEAAINWNSKPASATTSSGTGAVTGTTAAWYEVDLTTLLKQRKAAGATAVTLVLKGTATTGSFIIFDSDESASGNAPQLVVTPPPQALVLSTSSVAVPEGGSAGFTVKLAAKPASDVIVNVATAAGGDADLASAAGPLTFTPANWDVAQTVTLTAAEDADTTNGAASFALSSPGLAGKTVTATEADNDVPAAPVTLRAVGDAYVRDGSAYAGTNYGTATQLQVKRGTAGYTRESYLRFDLSSVGATFTSAKLRLFGKLDNSESAGAGFTVFDSVATTWGETAVTWNTRPAAGTTPHGSGNVTGRTGKWYEVDLTAFLQTAKAAGRTSVTLVLKASAASPSNILFDSDEAANRPQLVVS